MSLFQTLTRILAIVGKELVSVVRRPGALVSLVFGPFLIMAIFGLGYSGFRRPLDTIVVVPPQTGLAIDRDTYSKVAGEGLQIIDVVPDETVALQRLARQEVDVVLVAPADIQERFKAGERTPIKVQVNVTDPVRQSYAVFLARGLEAAINRNVIEQAVAEGEGYAISKGASPQDLSKIPPDVISAPTEAQVENIAPSNPTVVQFFGPAVLALILQHMAVTLIALSVVRDRMSGVMELFRVSSVSAWEVVAGKILGFGVLCAAIAAVSLALLVGGLGVPMLGTIGMLAGVLALLVLASLGLGLLISIVSDSERQAVQLSLLVLLASVFFSGFAVPIAEFSEPVRVAAYAIPVTNGITLIQDVMLRGVIREPWHLWILASTAGVLLASVFFSGFVLPITEFSEPVRSIAYALPVTHGIRLLQDLMLRGTTTHAWELLALGIIAMLTLFLAWVLLRRGMTRA